MSGWRRCAISPNGFRPAAALRQSEMDIRAGGKPSRFSTTLGIDLNSAVSRLISRPGAFTCSQEILQDPRL